MSGKNNIGDLILYGRGLNIRIFKFWRQNPRMNKYSISSAKQQLSNIKHGDGIRFNVCALTFDSPL